MAKQQDQAAESTVAEPLSEVVAEHVAAQLKEYGTYVATQKIWAGPALAYDEGDAVPVSNVERHGYDQLGWVKKVG